MVYQAGHIPHLAGHLYEAAANPELWSATLGKVAEAFGSRGCLLTTQDFTPGSIPHSSGLKDVLDQFFSENWHTCDLRTEVAIQKNLINGFFTDRHVISTNDMHRSDYYRNFAAKAGVPWFSAAVVGGHMKSDFVAISLQRSASDGAFTQTELDSMNAILPHMKSAIHLAKRLSGGQGKSMIAGLDIGGHPSILLDRTGKVVEVNKAALALLGRGLTINRTRLVTDDIQTNACLTTLIDRAAALAQSKTDTGNLSPLVINAQDGKATLLLRAAPIRHSGSEIFGFCGVMVMLTDLDAPSKIEPSLLRDMFGLTKREAQVMALIGKCHKPEAVAQQLSISRDAVRFHLKAIFSKTNIHSQSEIVQLLGRL